MNRFVLMCLGVVAVLALFTVQATAGPPTSSHNEISCSDISCPIATSTPAEEDCTIDFATCMVNQPSECDNTTPTDIEDTPTADIASSAARQSECDNGAIPQVIGTIEVFNVGTSISVAVLSAGHYNSKSDLLTKYQKEVSKRIICMVPMDSDSGNLQVTS